VGRILVVDDEELVRTPLRIALERAGHTVEEAADGQDGFDKFSEVQADVVIVDIFMPIKSGLEMIQDIRRVNREVNIIAMSGVDIRDGLDIETQIQLRSAIK
jgi:YesN/AraC family two-component response regulator